MAILKLLIVAVTLEVVRAGFGSFFGSAAPKALTVMDRLKVRLYCRALEWTASVVLSSDSPFPPPPFFSTYHLVRSSCTSKRCVQSYVLLCCSAYS